MEVNASESLVFATSKAALPDSQPLEEMIILETSVVLEREVPGEHLLIVTYDTPMGEPMVNGVFLKGDKPDRSIIPAVGGSRLNGLGLKLGMVSRFAALECDRGSNHSVGTCPIDPPALIGIPQVAPKDTIVNIAPSLSQEKHSTIEVIERKEDQVLKEKNGRVLPNSIKGTGGKITTK
ncbi:hypothetical protein V6N12_016906 [Hibiscus sabdariffa]|uniref:Uncharacterized protein n=1 Tax=Hibiscus sabdariffa TaxID=183260 RepID=A0ABR2AR35_9ROSI